MTDEQIIERTRQSIRWRRPAAMAATIMAVWSLSISYLLYSRWEQVGASLVPLFAGTADEELKTESLKMIYSLGVSQGVRVGGLMAAGLTLVGIAVSLLSGGRRDRLLVALYEHSRRQRVGDTDGEPS